MLVVKVELWPGGDEKRVKEIARMAICNISFDDSDPRGDYDCVTFRGRGKNLVHAMNNWRRCPWRRDPSALPSGVTRRGRVTNHPRKTAHVWKLIKKALEACYP